MASGADGDVFEADGGVAALPPPPGPPADADRRGNGQAKAAAAPKFCEKKMCECCGEEERVANCRYGPECKKGLNNLTHHENKAGKTDPERKARFDAVKKAGGAELNALILAYLRQCSSSQGKGKKRGTIDTMEILEKWQNEKFNTSGCRLLLMPLTRWLRHAQEIRGLTGSQAQVQWDEKEAAYGRGMLSQKYWKKENDQLWLAMPERCPR